MKTRLIITEGLPQNGNGDVARIVAEYLSDKGIKTQCIADGVPDCAAASDCANDNGACNAPDWSKKWRTFVQNADKNTVYVLGGALLGGAANSDGDEWAKSVREAMQIAKQLNPTVIYCPAAGSEHDERERIRRECDLLGGAADLMVAESSGADAVRAVAEQIVKSNGASAVKKEIWRAVKFTLFSISAGAIQLVSSLLLKLLILDKVMDPNATMTFIILQPTSTFIADTVGLALSVLWNFTFNRKFTFKAASNVPLAMLLAFLFYVPFYPFQIWYVAMVERNLANLGDWGYIIGLGTCMIINFVLEFLWQQFVVFRGKVDTNDIAQKGGKTRKSGKN